MRISTIYYIIQNKVLSWLRNGILVYSNSQWDEIMMLFFSLFIYNKTIIEIGPLQI